MKWLALIALLFVQPAFAAAPEQVDPSLCRALVQHTPSADVAYQPGVDSHGHYVAPADLPSANSLPLPSKITIPLTVSLVKALNFDTAQYPYNQLGSGTEAQLGTLTVEGNNVTLNGKPLTNAQQDNLAVLCMKPEK